MFYSPATGPFSSVPIPSNVIVTEPASDNNIDIGTATKRYRTLYATDVKTTSIECSTITASTSVTVNGLNVVLNNETTPITGAKIPKYSDPTGNLIEDSGVDANAVVVTGTGTSVDQNVAVFQGTNGKTIVDGGISVADVVYQTPVHTQFHVAVWNNDYPDASLGDGPKVADVVTNTGTSTTANFASFTNTSGKTIQDSTWKAGSFTLAQFSLYPIEPVTITGTSTQTILGPGLGDLVIPANSTVGGSFLHIRAVAYGNIDAAASVQFILSINGNLNGLTYTSGGGSLGIWYQHDIWLNVVGPASGGTVLSWSMIASDGTILTAPANGTWGGNGSSHAIDFQANFSTASAGNTLSCKQFIVERGFLP